MDVEAIAKGLSQAQRRYLIAVGEGPYLPRHGTTANWALRHGYAVLLYQRPIDDKIVPWEHLTSDCYRSAEAVGCSLTPLGKAVRAYLEGEG